MLIYFQTAIKNGYHIEILEPETPWKTSEKSLATKNTHSVPLDSIRRMKKKYETGVGLHELLRTYNLQMSSPKKRNIPPLQKKDPDIPEPVVKESLQMFGGSQIEHKDLIDFTVSHFTLSDVNERIQARAAEVPVVKSNSPAFQWALPSEAYEASVTLPDESAEKIDHIDGIDTVGTAGLHDILLNALTENKDSTTGTPQTGKNKMGKKKEPKLVPHRKNCSNENENFANIREFLPHLNETYLWDFFFRCNGDAEWCANLLFEDNLEGNTPSGESLTCSCDSEVSKDSLPKKEVIQQQKKSGVVNAKPASPAIKQKKGRQDVFNVDEYLQMKEAKEAIEKSITFAPSAYPEHVNRVKNWKQGIPTPSGAAITSEQPETTQIPSSPDIDDELQAVTISSELILELDEEYGGGLLKSLRNGTGLPPKVFVKRSTAYQLYKEILEAFQSHEEEKKIQTMRDDEVFAKKLSEEDVLSIPKENGLDFTVVDVQSKWIDNDDDEDFSVKMSKEKLVKLFTGLNEVDLMEIFKVSRKTFKKFPIVCSFKL